MGHGSPEGDWRYGSTLSLTLDGGGSSKPSPGRFTPGKGTRYPSYRRLGGAEGRSGRVMQISPPPLGIRLPTFQAEASRYNGYATLAHRK